VPEEREATDTTTGGDTEDLNEGKEGGLWFYSMQTIMMANVKS
jgi:hypothetical protein